MDELKGVQADLGITDGNPELIKVRVPHSASSPLSALPLPCLEGSFLTAFGKGGSL